jgi:hypothetical protein
MTIDLEKSGPQTWRWVLIDAQQRLLAHSILYPSRVACRQAAELLLLQGVDQINDPPRDPLDPRG